MDCPADLETGSAALRYVLRECGKERVYSLRPQVGEFLTLPPDIRASPNHNISLLIVRASQRLIDKGSTMVHLPILDPERPAFSLVNLYHTLMNLFEGSGIRVVLHNRVYVSILSIGLEKTYQHISSLVPRSL